MRLFSEGVDPLPFSNCLDIEDAVHFKSYQLEIEIDDFLAILKNELPEIYCQLPLLGNLVCISIIVAEQIIDSPAGPGWMLRFARLVGKSIGSNLIRSFDMLCTSNIGRTRFPLLKRYQLIKTTKYLNGRTSSIRIAGSIILSYLLVTK